MKQLKLPLEEAYRRLVIDYLNLVFTNSKQSDEYWDKWLKKDLIVNFPESLSPQEDSDSFTLKPKNGKTMMLLFERIKKIMGLKFIKREYNFNLESQFDDTDLENIGERVKHMNIIAHAQGFFYHIKGMGCRVEDPMSSKKFYEAAIEKFEEALDSDPNNKEILLSIALTWILSIEEDYKKVPNAKFSPDDPKVKKAEEYSLRAISVVPKYDAFSLFRYAQFLERCNRLDSAEDYYLMALEVEPNNPGCLHCYGNLLTQTGLHEEAEKFYLRSSQNTIGKKHWPEYYY